MLRYFEYNKKQKMNENVVQHKITQRFQEWEVTGALCNPTDAGHKTPTQNNAKMNEVEARMAKDRASLSASLTPRRGKPRLFHLQRHKDRSLSDSPKRQRPAGPSGRSDASRRSNFSVIHLRVYHHL